MYTYIHSIIVQLLYGYWTLPLIKYFLKHLVNIYIIPKWWVYCPRQRWQHHTAHYSLSLSGNQFFGTSFPLDPFNFCLLPRLPSPHFPRFVLWPDPPSGKCSCRCFSSALTDQKAELQPFMKQGCGRPFVCVLMCRRNHVSEELGSLKNLHPSHKHT